jgi:hypothetical protein
MEQTSFNEWFEFLTNHYFTFGQRDGLPFAWRMRLDPTGRIANYESPQEHYWQLVNGTLEFQNTRHDAVTRFELPESPRDMVNGTITGKVLRQADTYQVLVTMHGEAVNTQTMLELQRRQDARNRIIRPTKVRAHQHIRLAVILNNVETLPALEPLLLAAQQADDIELKILTTKKLFGQQEDLGTMAALDQHLSALGLPFIAVASEFTTALTRLARWQADFILRQSEWDEDYPDAFKADNLDWARLIVVPYVITENMMMDAEHGDQTMLTNPYYEHIWRYFLPEPLTASQRLQIQASFVAEEVFEHVGSMKAQVIKNTQPQWPIADLPHKLVWMAHHSIYDAWFNMGIFPAIRERMLSWTKAHPDVAVLFNPHPLLRANLANNAFPGLSGRDYEQFLQDFAALPNGGVLENAPQNAATAAADVILTDGISSLYEMQVQAKPVVGIIRDDHTPFTDLGTQLMTGVHTHPDLTGALADVARLFTQPDELAEQQRQNVQPWLSEPHPEQRMLAAMRTEMQHSH